MFADCEKAGPQELSVKSGDMVQLIREGEEEQWYSSSLKALNKDNANKRTLSDHIFTFPLCSILCRFVKNLRSGKEGWVAAANLLSLISESKSSQSLSSSGMFLLY